MLAAQFYIQRKPRVGINKAYYENQKIIDFNTFKIFTDKICAYNPSRNNLAQIIDALKNRFSGAFPILADKSNNNNNQIIAFGPANPDLRKMNEVIVESDKMTNKQVYELIKKQAKDAVFSKYQQFNSKYKL